MGHARALIGKTPQDFDQQILEKINKGDISVRNLEKKKIKKTTDVNLVQEEQILSSTIGFKAKITHNKIGRGSIKIFYDNLEQYKFIINKLKN